MQCLGYKKRNVPTNKVSRFKSRRQTYELLIYLLANTYSCVRIYLILICVDCSINLCEIRSILNKSSAIYGRYFRYE